MKPYEKEALLKMVGTQGLQDLECIANLIPDSDADAYMIGCRLLNYAIYQCKKNLEKFLNEFGIEEKNRCQVRVKPTS